MAAFQSTCMALYKDKFRVETVRAEWIDYSDGVFFITICTHDKRHLLGHVNEGVMQLSKVGVIVEKCISRIADSHTQCRLWNHVVMPNHVHLLIQVNKGKAESDSCDQPTNDNVMSQIAAHCGKVSHIVGQFKAAVTREAHTAGLEMAWQTRFHDHMVRNYDELCYINQYIVTNPANWSQDVLSK